MKPGNEWITLDEPHTDLYPDPILLRVQNLSPRQIFPMHSHTWHQLIYSVNGTFLVAINDAWHVVTPNHAIWVPAGCSHTSGAQNGAEFRNLYIADIPGKRLPTSSAVFAVSNLLRELIKELEQVNSNDNEQSYTSLLTDLILDQFHRLPTKNFSLPWPSTPMLRKYCESLIDNPSDERSIEQWGTQLGASTRTLTRKFEAEVGLTIRQWNRKLKAFLAMEKLSRDQSVTEVSIDLGYSSVSAFTFMFRQEIGLTPSEWRKGQTIE